MLVSGSSLPLEPSTRLIGAARGELLIVADGMGGHAGGQHASSTAVDHLITELLNTVHWFLQIEHDCEEHFVQCFREALQNAHEEILSQSIRDPSKRGMGTTLTMAYIVWPKMYIVHAGDSRCYLIRGKEIQQLTTDHTLAHQLVQSGGLPPEEEATSRWSNVLWNVLGGAGKQQLYAEVLKAELQAGDTVLLCSDGLNKHVTDSGIAAAVEQGVDAEHVCKRLVREANQGGGADNITVVVSQPVPKTIVDVDDGIQSNETSSRVEKPIAFVELPPRPSMPPHGRVVGSEDLTLHSQSDEDDESDLGQGTDFSFGTQITPKDTPSDRSSSVDATISSKRLISEDPSNRETLPE